MNSILVVDDDADGREAVTRFLSRSGYSVRSAPNGRAALMSLLTTYPDVIILDMMMPEMSGLELLEVMRSYLRMSKLPVILLTAYPAGQHIERAKELGVRCVFSKTNYNLSTLRECVAQLIADPNSDCQSAG
ncbi:MAG: hypothetical protein JWO87_3633 [Phycisphaerales bacterium]|nr:hypothetical protein [Phycisphaerales bacterium]MDB5301970.1 hypothetical protein [Phycisphaerales bacterium]MDB5304681.1 hypothetical protein [Phycisphaerales bacterium]